MSGENLGTRCDNNSDHWINREHKYVAWGLAQLGAVSVRPRSEVVFQVEPWLTACLTYNPSGGFVDQAFVVDLLDVEQINQIGLPETQAEMGVGRGAPGSRTNPNQACTTPIRCSSSFLMEAARVRRELFDQEHWDSWILPRLTDDPTARDLSIRSTLEALARVGRSGEAKALAENFHELRSGQNDVWNLPYDRAYWNTAESQESNRTGCSAWELRHLDQQVRPALVELAKAMTTSDSGLDVGPVVDHLDATVRSPRAGQC